MVSPNFDFEISHIPKNTRFLLGLDEVGRGPWAGPVAVAAFLLDLKYFNLDFFVENKIRDSKTLSNKQRRSIKQKFDDNNYPYKTFFVKSHDIDRLGISRSISLAADKAVDHFRSQIDFVLVDGNISLDSLVPHRNINKADQNCFSVASASICAKVTRDTHMEVVDKKFPGYHFAQHKGYGTKLHLQALNQLGVCPIHRLSYKPIKNFI